MDGETPDISFIIPVYNREQLINRTLESCKNPEIKVEIIIVDDGSTDRTAEVTNNWKNANQGKKLSVILVQKENFGAGSARNSGLEFATGPFVLFLDSDDQLNQQFIQSALKFFQKVQDLQIVYGGYRVFNGDKLIRTSQAGLEERVIQEIICSWLTHPSAIIYSRLFLIDNNLAWDEQLPSMQDFDFTLKCFQKAEKIKRMRVYAVDIHETGDRISTHRFKKWNYEINRHLGQVLDDFEQSGEMEMYKPDFATRAYNYLKSYIKAGNRRGIHELIALMHSHQFPVPGVIDFLVICRCPLWLIRPFFR